MWYRYEEQASGEFNDRILVTDWLPAATASFALHEKTE
jgi:hypothetical protein